MTRMQISVGPILYFWSKPRVFSFYRRLQEAPVDTVYLGETVCSKRRELRLDDWLAIAHELQGSGKQAVLSTLSLIMAESEMSQIQRAVETSDLLIEANDLAAVQVLAARRLPFTLGPGLNVYNPQTLAVFARLGALRWVPPVELSGQSLAALLLDFRTEYPQQAIQTEVFAYGHLPLAYSARCYTARHLGLTKDNCQFRCIEFPEGIALNSQDGTPLFMLNGLQTQSAALCNLLHQMPAMREMGVDRVRLSPQEHDFLVIVDRFHAQANGVSDALSLADHDCNGYWFGQPGMVRVE